MTETEELVRKKDDQLFDDSIRIR